MEFRAMELHNSLRRSTHTSTGKRRRFDCDNVFHREYEGDNFVSTDVISPSPNHDSITPIKAQLELVSSSSSSSNEKHELSKEESSVICLSSNTEMEHSTPKKKSKNSSTEDEATSPSAGELDEFFSKAEKYDHKRFAEKYNYDIVKDVPIEGGRYQWIHL